MIESVTDAVLARDTFAVPEGARVRRTDGRGPFVTRVEWQHPDGSTATWDSRQARKRGLVEIRCNGAITRIHTRAAHTRRLGLSNNVAGFSFFLGGGLFTLGALLSQFDAATTTAINWTFLIGGFFFSTGAYATLVQEINSPRSIGDNGALTENRWRWRAYEPRRPGWVSAFVLFCGTLAFAISLVDVFLTSLTTAQTNRLIWAPEMVGCVLFLVSGHIGIIEVCHGRFRLLPRSLGWWIVVVNQVGSWLFLLSGLAAFVRPATGSVISVAVINWGTALGAACFSAAGVAQLFERPTLEPAASPALPVARPRGRT